MLSYPAMPHRAPGAEKSGAKYLTGKAIRYYRPRGSADLRHLIEEGFQAFNAARLCRLVPLRIASLDMILMSSALVSRFSWSVSSSARQAPRARYRRFCALSLPMFDPP